MKRTVQAILFVVYSIIAITVTVLLLSFNDYRMSEIGGYTVYIVSDDALEPEYDEGSILLIEETSDKHVNVGDEVFLYKVESSQDFEVVKRTLVNKATQGRHTIYHTDQGETFDSSYFVGKTEETSIIGKPWGTILSILESKWGYLFCIVIVSLLLFLQEVFDLIIELKYGGGKSKKAKNVKTANAKTATSKATTQKKSTTTKTTTTKVATAAKKVADVVEANNTQTGEKENG